MRILLSAALAMTLAACAGDSGEGEVTEPVSIYETEQGRDEHSYARPADARVTHIDLDLNIFFERKEISGTATLDVDVTDGIDEVVLDARGLEIAAITSPDGAELDWALGEGDAAHGAPLTVQLDGARQIVIQYASAPDAAALQWLTPEQTAGGEQPFLFSQGQAILNRSWIPTQDSPGIRQTWRAHVSVEVPLTVVMSGARCDQPDDTMPPPNRVSYCYEMTDPVPPYLIAIAAGDLDFREIGPRSGIYAEPSVVDDAAEEFSEVEQMIDAAEDLYGPYRWGRYDMIVLPPAFPFGGMENPRLTFLTPTVIAGDKSLVALVAHELAHSWSGNLVTNANWNDFWLNEGFTVYFENRIMEAVYGAEDADMLRTLGYQELEEEITALGGPENADTQLHLALSGRDPDDGMTSIAYEKGSLFLQTIEKAVGRERFDAWLRSYFDRFAFQPQTSEGLIADMREHLFDGEDPPVDLQAWIYEPGIPEGANIPSSGRFDAVNARIEAFVNDGDTSALGWNDWTTQEKLHFLNGLPRELSLDRMRALDEAHGLANAGNSEVRYAFLRLAIMNRYDPAKPAAADFLRSMGRRKFVEPLFKALMDEGDWGQPFARDLYEEVRPGYHSVTTGSVDEVVGR